MSIEVKDTHTHNLWKGVCVWLTFIDIWLFNFIILVTKSELPLVGNNLIFSETQYNVFITIPREYPF